jgi:hypothetical protein
MNHNTIDTSSMHGFISSCSFIFLGHLSAWLGSLDLQTYSYAIAILVGIDTLTGSPIKSSFKKIWKKICDRF